MPGAAQGDESGGGGFFAVHLALAEGAGGELARDFLQGRLQVALALREEVEEANDPDVAEAMLAVEREHFADEIEGPFAHQAVDERAASFEEGGADPQDDAVAGKAVDQLHFFELD